MAKTLLRERDRGGGRKSERASNVRNREGQRARERKAQRAKEMREGNLRGGGSKGRVIVVVVRAILSRLAVNQSSHGSVRSFAVSQSVSQSANRQPSQPS